MASNQLIETASGVELGADPTATGHRRQLPPALATASGVLLLLLLLAAGFILGLAFAAQRGVEKSGADSGRGGGRQLLAAQLSTDSQRPSGVFAEFALDTESSPGNCGPNSQQPCWQGGSYLTSGDLGPLRQLSGDGFALTEDRRKVRLSLDGVFAIDAQVRVKLDGGHPTLRGHLEVNGLPSKLFCGERTPAAPTTSQEEAARRTVTCRLNGFAKFQAGDELAVRLELFNVQPVLSQPDSSFIRLVKLG